MLKKGLNFAALIVLTVGSAILMLTSAVGSGRLGRAPNQVVAKKADLKIPPTRVAVRQVSPETLDVVQSYSGTIRPFERYTASFEIMGRLAAFGKDDQGRPIDIGSTVIAGQPLAYLDNAERVAMLDETNARLEKAQAERQRYERLRGTGEALVTEERWLQVITELKMAEATKQRMEKQLKDTTLSAPQPLKPRDDGKPQRFRVSKRTGNQGQSINAHQALFELIEVDRLRLVVGVPESRIADVKVNQRVLVERFAQNLFGEKLPTLEGRVYQVGEAADAATGLFEVEVVLYNDHDELRPGMFAMAHLVVEEIPDGFRLPLASMVYRDGRNMLFYVDAENRARALPIERYIEQGADVLIERLAPEHRQVVVRGQHRLVDGREVELVGDGEPEVGAPETALRVVTPQ